MKKLTLLIALMLIMAMSVSALELEPTITGSATVTWGYDLDTNATGFLSETASSLTLTLLSGSETKGADADVYGEITLDGFGIEFGDTLDIDYDDAFIFYDADGNTLDNLSVPYVPTGDVKNLAKLDDVKFQTGLNVNAPEVTAKIVLSPTMSLIIASAPEIAFNYAEVLDKEKDVNDDDIDAQITGDDDGVYHSTGGITLALDLSPITLDIEVASGQDWDGADDQAYAFQATVGADVAPATIEASFATGVNYAKNPIGVGLSVNLDLGMLEPSVGFDLEVGDSATLFDVLVKVPVTISDDITAGLSASVAEDGDDTTDLDLDIKAEAAATISIATIGFDVILKDLIVENVLGFDVNANLALALTETVKFSVEGGFDMGVVDVDDDDRFDISAAIDLKMIPNTTITLKYASKQLIDEMTNCLDDDEDYTVIDKGVISLATVIEY